MSRLRLPKHLLACLFAFALAPLASAQSVNQNTPQPVSQPAAPPPVYVPTSLAPEPGLPRTPGGHPDFQDVVWATNFFPVFEASPMAASLVVSEAEAKKMLDAMVSRMTSIPDFAIDPEAHEIIGNTDGLPIVRGERRSRLIVLPADGKLPLKAEVKKAVAAVNTMDGGKDDYEQRPSGERCLVLGAPPAHAVVSYNRLRLIQTPTHLVIHSENGDEARIVPFATEHKPAGSRSLSGDAIARWDGDTLVVETVRQPQSARVRGFMTKFVVDEQSKVIERFTRLSKNELLYQFTVDDPDLYSTPWLAEYSFYRTDTGMFPGACHEHNYSLPNILLGARVKDARVVATKP